MCSSSVLFISTIPTYKHIGHGTQEHDSSGTIMNTGEASNTTAEKRDTYTTIYIMAIYEYKSMHHVHLRAYSHRYVRCMGFSLLVYLFLYSLLFCCFFSALKSFDNRVVGSTVSLPLSLSDCFSSSSGPNSSISIPFLKHIICVSR